MIFFRHGCAFFSFLFLFENFFFAKVEAGVFTDINAVVLGLDKMYSCIKPFADACQPIYEDNLLRDSGDRSERYRWLIAKLISQHNLTDQERFEAEGELLSDAELRNQTFRDLKNQIQSQFNMQEWFAPDPEGDFVTLTPGYIPPHVITDTMELEPKILMVLCPDRTLLPSRLVKNRSRYTLRPEMQISGFYHALAFNLYLRDDQNAEEVLRPPPRPGLLGLWISLALLVVIAICLILWYMRRKSKPPVAKEPWELQEPAQIPSTSIYPGNQPQQLFFNYPPNYSHQQPYLYQPGTPNQQQYYNQPTSPLDVNNDNSLASSVAQSPAPQNPLPQSLPKN